MSFACRGLTHCSKCMTPLNMGEFGLCKSCEEEEKKKQQLLEEEEKREQLKTEIRAEIVQEVKDDVRIDVLKELTEAKYSNQIGTIDVNPVKPKEDTYSSWYEDIGYKIVEAHNKGFNEVLICFKKEDNQ